MENQIYQRQLEFTAPSGYKYTIREQNGEDDDVLSNPSEAKTLRNISRFISSLVTHTDATPSGRLSLDDAHNLPALDRYAILFNSRIFSIGNELEFTYNWGEENGGEVGYIQDLEDFIFDYSQEPNEEMLKEKPKAIPYYPMGKKNKDLEIITSSGKKLLYDLIDTSGESYLVNLPVDKISKNQGLIARNLRVEIDGKYEKVLNFRIFSVRDMQEIRREVQTNDPVFEGLTEITNPITGEIREISVVAIKDFFYPGEI